MSKRQNHGCQGLSDCYWVENCTFKCFVVPYTRSQREKLCRNISPLKKKQFELGHRKKQRWLDIKCYKEE